MPPSTNIQFAPCTCCFPRHHALAHRFRSAGAESARFMSHFRSACSYQARRSARFDRAVLHADRNQIKVCTRICDYFSSRPLLPVPGTFADEVGTAFFKAQTEQGRASQAYPISTHLLGCAEVVVAGFCLHRAVQPAPLDLPWEGKGECIFRNNYINHRSFSHPVGLASVCKDRTGAFLYLPSAVLPKCLCLFFLLLLPSLRGYDVKSRRVYSVNCFLSASWLTALHRPTTKNGRAWCSTR